mmetsp:Transcript_10025/g.24294  ORF Transcript_10025/g.24294 Transcript_10025/m.24294 type:complete len:218 (-) Transcript_10025:49-702(-)|eukprot:CAMPEP_0168810564 /NCGR_PEP_ID=MMETSP0726-20121227/3665_1 /TAXON_ID=265536 /ORGANISM="Amphiprora sp., Strain CCMP467" /LENGTH=217 /DNA_ID=CAMNT_0008862581 /DNA_START=30 /DNA_END=683 /DNA_ORIENTATION=-
MKARTLKNPLKIIVNKCGKNKLVDLTEESAHSASFSVDGGSGTFSTKRKRSLPLFRVSFAEEVTCRECSHNLSAEEVARDLWYSKHELQNMKKGTQYGVKMARGASAGGSCYTTALEKVFDSCTKAQVSSCDDQAELWAQLQVHIARTGLEKLILKKSLDHRRQCRRELVQLVNSVYVNYPHSTLREVAMILRKKCAQISKPAVLFAAEIAKAQAVL